MKPDLMILICSFDKVIAFDHLKQKIFIIVNVKVENFERGYIEAVER